MRLLRLLLPLACVLPACADFEGKSYPRVVQASDVEFKPRLPDDYRMIGSVTASSSDPDDEEEDNDWDDWEDDEIFDGELLEALLFKTSQPRLRRRMRRVAARNGGELLVGFHCEEYHDGSALVLDCFAGVARLRSRNER